MNLFILLQPLKAFLDRAPFMSKTVLFEEPVSSIPVSSGDHRSKCNVTSNASIYFIIVLTKLFLLPGLQPSVQDPVETFRLS